jgi:hypothetical protein
MEQGKELGVPEKRSSTKFLAAGPKRLLTNNLIAYLELHVHTHLYRILPRIYYQEYYKK